MEATPTNVSPVGRYVILQSVGASESTARNASELSSVVKVNLTVIAGRVRKGVAEPLERGRRLTQLLD